MERIVMCLDYRGARHFPSLESIEGAISRFDLIIASIWDIDVLTAMHLQSVGMDGSPSYVHGSVSS